MKHTLLPLVLVAMLAGCSTPAPNIATVPESDSTPSPQVEPIVNQRLTSSFDRRTIKIGLVCSNSTGTISKSCTKSEVDFIEVTGYAATNGSTSHNKEQAFVVAEMIAKSKLRHFISEDVTSDKVVNTVTKTFEKATDLHNSNSDNVDVADDETVISPGNTMTRDNSNNIARKVTEVIKVNAKGILRGVKTINEEIVDAHTVAVTIRWDRESNVVSKFLSKQFQ